ncbi:MAG: hypothetical protein RSG57_05675, partial [Christensenellaceae bacterium]
MGVTTSELQQMTAQGKMMATDVLPLLSEGLGERFGGSMEKQSKTMSGMLSTAKDLMSQLMADTTKGAFDELKGGLAGVNRELASPAAKTFAKEFGGAIGKVTKGVLEFLKGAWEARDAIAAIGTAALTYTVIVKAGAAITKFKKDVEGATMAQKLWNAAQLSNPIGWVTLAISAAAGAFVAFKAAADKANKPIIDLKKSTDEMAESVAEMKRSLTNGKITIEADFSVAKTRIADIKDMIDNKEWGETLDLKIQDMIDKFPELAGAIEKSGDIWVYHEEKLDSILGKLQRNAELTYLLGKYQEAVNVQQDYKRNEENKVKLEDAEKETAERKTAYDERAAEKDERLADGGQIYQSYLGDLQRLEGEWKTAQETV